MIQPGKRPLASFFSRLALGDSQGFEFKWCVSNGIETQHHIVGMAFATSPRSNCAMSFAPCELFHDGHENGHMLSNDRFFTRLMSHRLLTVNVLLVQAKQA